MGCKIVVVTLLALLVIKDGHADTDDKLVALAHKFSPILILTEDTERPKRRVLKPEPVRIVGAESARNLVFHYSRVDTNIDGGVQSFEDWTPPLQDVVRHLGVDFSQNRFASLPSSFRYGGIPPSFSGSSFQYIIMPRFDYPGSRPEGTDEWNDTYFGTGPKAGSIFENTAYVHIFDHRDPLQNGTRVTVIQYFYFFHIMIGGLNMRAIGRESM